MMNKKNLWFLTLFSLVLVLSIYYVTMPEDLLAASTSPTDLVITACFSLSASAALASTRFC